jgi:hypothetical protein
VIHLENRLRPLQLFAFVTPRSNICCHEAYARPYYLRRMATAIQRVCADFLASCIWAAGVVFAMVGTNRCVELHAGPTHQPLLYVKRPERDVDFCHYSYRVRWCKSNALDNMFPSPWFEFRAGHMTSSVCLSPSRQIPCKYHEWVTSASFAALSNSLTASVVLWSQFLATDTEVPGSIPGPTSFSEK